MQFIEGKGMKRSHPSETENLNFGKNGKFIYLENPLNVPAEVWQQIASYLEAPSINNLRLTAPYFARDDVILLNYLQKVVVTFFDYKDEAELSFVMKQSNLHHLDKIPAYQCLITGACSKAREVQLQLELREDTNAKVSYQFLEAAQYGHIQIVNLYIKSTTYLIVDIINFRDEELAITALGHAAINSRKQIFSLLLTNGAEFVLGEISPDNNNHLVCFDIGYDQLRDVTPLHIIALQSDDNWLCDILNQFPDALTPAIFSDAFQVHLRYIIENNHQKLAESPEAADNPVFQEQDAAGWSLLHWAACLGKVECVTVLINKGINVDKEAGKEKVLPLDVACAAGKLTTFNELVLCGATIPEELDNEGNTYLHLAASNGYYELVAYLVQELKMDINEKNDNEITPLYLAKKHVDSEDVALSANKIAMKIKCANLLIELGAKEDMLVEKVL
jgi:ankyrin repeat protein